MPLWQEQPRGLPPVVQQGMQPAFPQAGFAAGATQQYRQQLGQGPQAPPISANSIWSDQDIQNQLNQTRAMGDARLAARFRGMNNQAAAQGFNPNSRLNQGNQNRLWALQQSQHAQNENNLRFNTAQSRAQHQLATEQARSNQWEKSLQDDLSRTQLGAGLAESEAGRQQQVGMSGLEHAQNVYRQGMDIDAQLQRLREQLASGEKTAAEQFRLNWAISNLENQRALALQGMAGQQAMSQEALRMMGAQGMQGLQNQQQQWGQTFGTAADFERMRQDAMNREYDMRLQQALAQRAWMEQQTVGAERDVAGRQWDVWGGMNLANNQAQNQGWLQYMQDQRQMPFQQAQIDLQSYLGGLPYRQDQRQYSTMQRMLENLTSGGVPQLFAMSQPNQQTSYLTNLIAGLRQMLMMPPGTPQPNFAQPGFLGPGGAPG